MGIMFNGACAVSDKDVVVFGHMRFWAENGLIHTESSIDGAYDCMSVREALTRANAISDMLGNSTAREIHSEDQFDQANRLRHMRMLEGLQAIFAKAKIQGMPSDASARRDRIRRRPVTVVVPKTYGGGM